MTVSAQCFCADQIRRREETSSLLLVTGEINVAATRLARSVPLLSLLLLSLTLLSVSSQLTTWPMFAQQEVC